MKKNNDVQKLSLLYKSAMFQESGRKVEYFSQQPARPLELKTPRAHLIILVLPSLQDMTEYHHSLFNCESDNILLMCSTAKISIDTDRHQSK